MTLALGHIDKTFEWLEHAWEVNDAGLNSMKGDPWMRAIEDDPRTIELHEKMGLD